MAISSPPPSSTEPARIVIGAFCQVETPPEHEPEGEYARDVCKLMRGIDNELDAVSHCLQNQADKTARFALGLIFGLGLLQMPQNRRVALHYLSLAKEDDHATAEYILDVYAVYGTFNSPDARASLQETREVGLQLGAYANLGAEASKEDAPDLYAKGFYLNDAEATLLLAECYEEGVGVDQDPKAALALYRAGAAMASVDSEVD